MQWDAKTDQLAAFPEWSHRYVCTRDYPSFGKGCQIRVEAGLHYLRGNSLPYFGVTAAIGTPRELHTGDYQAGGCCHEDILRVWPELAPVVALHLSDSEGQPMHAEADGWYWLAGYYGGAGETYRAGNGSSRKHAAACLQSWADHVRIPVETARALADGWRCEDDWTASRRWCAQWLEAQRGRFTAEAEAACQVLDELIRRDGGSDAA